MKTAREMFESMGWKCTEHDCGYIEYNRGFRTILFAYWDKDKNEGIVNSSGHIDMLVLKAINKQCEELGWNK